LPVIDFPSLRQLDSNLANRTIPPRRAATASNDRGGFTLVELLVVIAILGILMSLLLAAVQASRDAARRASCANNLRNLATSLHEFQAANNYLPAGRLVLGPGREFSWSLQALPYLEQAALHAGFDRTKPWDDARGNAAFSETALPVFRCPAGILKFPGDSDYGGMKGSSLTIEGRFDFSNGVLVPVGRRRKNYLRMAEIVDGTSNTIAIAECVDRPREAGGMWVSGLNPFSHDNGNVNNESTGDIRSRHLGGAYVAFADGSVRFLANGTDAEIVGGWCTRNGGEASHYQ
jgi:prepilin-type N-terminal cleavage/methylation domain-containing protein/prepilin-type processing-associated H-X9-DG protein